MTFLVVLYLLVGYCSWAGMPDRYSAWVQIAFFCLWPIALLSNLFRKLYQ